VYQVRGATALGFIRGPEAMLLADSAFYAQARHYRYAVQPHWWQLGVTQPRLDTLAGRVRPALAGIGLADGNVLVSWRGIRLLVCRRPPEKYNWSDLNLDYLILTQNVKFRLESLPNKKDKLLVIMDDSGSIWYQQKRAAQLRAHRFRVYQVSRQGAYIRVVD
jgi:competence protein ComEC